MFFNLPASGPDPGLAPVVHGPRRVKFIDPAIEEQKKYLALLKERANAPPPANWAEMFKRLPKDDEDNIDWMAALKDKIITPATGIDPATDKPAPKPLDMDVDISTSGKPDRLVVFPHAAHTQWLVCANCHPAIFEQEAGSAKITMAAINEGKFCGVCHDAVAVAQPSGCLGCHKVTAKKP